MTSDVKSEPLPLLRLERHTEAARDDAGLLVGGYVRCEARVRVTTTTTTEAERTAHGLWRDTLPIGAGVIAGIAADLRDPPKTGRDGGGTNSACGPSCALFGLLLGVNVSLYALSIDGLAQIDTTDVDQRIAVQTTQQRCDPGPLKATPVVLLLRDGTRKSTTTDMEGRVRLTPAQADLVHAIENRGSGRRRRRERAALTCGAPGPRRADDARSGGGTMPRDDGSRAPPHR